MLTFLILPFTYFNYNFCYNSMLWLTTKCIQLLLYIYSGPHKNLRKIKYNTVRKQYTHLELLDVFYI